MSVARATATARRRQQSKHQLLATAKSIRYAATTSSNNTRLLDYVSTVRLPADYRPLLAWSKHLPVSSRLGSDPRTSRWSSTGVETTLTRESSPVTLRSPHRVGRRRHAHRGSCSSSDPLPEAHALALVEPRHERRRTRALDPHISQITQRAAKYLKADRLSGDAWNSGPPVSIPVLPRSIGSFARFFVPSGPSRIQTS